MRVHSRNIHLERIPIPSLDVQPSGSTRRRDLDRFQFRSIDAKLIRLEEVHGWYESSDDRVVDMSPAPDERKN